MSEKCSNKDRIEARKAVDLANAHIYRLVSEGATFNILPEVRQYMPKSIEDKSNISYDDSTLTDISSTNNSTDKDKDKVYD